MLTELLTVLHALLHVVSNLRISNKYVLNIIGTVVWLMILHAFRHQCILHMWNTITLKIEINCASTVKPDFHHTIYNEQIISFSRMLNMFTECVNCNFIFLIYFASCLFDFILMLWILCVVCVDRIHYKFISGFYNNEALVIKIYHLNTTNNFSCKSENS